jgi:zinc D-Ala-D-Ala carboxypeptidase
MIDWGRYPNFSASEFVCRHTGNENMQQEFMDKLQALRFAYGKPMRITSGYRHPTHPIEARKNAPGPHTTGCAVDIAVSRGDAYRVLELAFALGFTGIGVQQKGDGRYIHLDTLTEDARPTIWSY